MDDDEPIAPSGEAVLYDYLKHLTSLCLFSLGGVAALADKVQGRAVLPATVALAVIGLAAFCSFYATGLIVEARFTGQPIRGRLDLYRHAAPLLLAVGIGMFFYLFATARQH